MTEPADVPPSIEPQLTEREKWTAESAFRDRELRLKEAEHANRKVELELQRAATSSQWRSPLVLAVLAAAIAALGSGVVAYLNGRAQRDLENQKAVATRILELIKTNDTERAADNLDFLLRTGLVDDDRHLRAKLDAFLSTRKPGGGPVLPSTTLTPPPPQVVTTDQAGSASVAARPDELAIARELQNHVAKGEYAQAAGLFDALHQSHLSGVGYSAYPEAALAYDQLGKEAEALKVLALLKDRLDQDAAKGYGYLAPGRFPRGMLAKNLSGYLTTMKSEKVKGTTKQLLVVLAQ